MSTTVDNRVVEMRFDNQNFERNVQTSMSTLEKLKQSLRLTGAAKGLENVNAAANKIDFSQVESMSTRAGFHVQDVWLKVSEVFEYQVARRIINAGRNMFNALMVAPVKDGWNEYEMTLNAVQTTMAGTGKTAEEVEKELKKLDDYADKTVYSTADMLNNLPKFTNAGVDLEKATKAMIGIANATALAGGDAGKASIAFYNLGQAIGTGYLTRMDYNSINNAGIATMEWKNQMVEAALAQKTLTKVGEDAYKAGNKTFTLQQLFIDGLQEQWATTDVMMKVFGDYGDETTAIGEKAYSAAQDIKTFTQMMESLKATAGTGWKETWQLIFGGLDEAKEFWTGLSNFISGVIGKIDHYRNTILEIALGNPFQKLLDRLDKVTSATDVLNKITKNYSEVVNEIIRGDWGNGQSRWDKLTEAGYDWAHAQNLVNEQLGDSTRHATNYKEAQDGVNDSLGVTLDQLAKMSPNQLKQYYSFTDEEIEALRELEEQSRKTGIPMEDLVKDMEQLDGRTLLINSFKNAGQALVDTFKAMKSAWDEIFHGDATQDEILNKRAEQLYDVIAALHKFSTYLDLTDDETGELNETGKNLQRTFKGIFALLDIITTIAGGGLKIAFSVLKSILSYFNMDVTDLTAIIGDAIVKFRDWLDSVLNFDGVISKIIPYIQKAATAIQDWVKALKESSVFKNFTKYLTSTGKQIKEWLSGLKDAENIPRYIMDGIVNAFKGGLKDVEYALGELGTLVMEKLRGIDAMQPILEWFDGIDEAENIPKYIVEGLVNGLKTGASAVWDSIVTLATGILTTICDILGIESPSKEFFAIGEYIIEGLVNGLKNGVSSVWEFLQGIGEKCIEVLGNINWGSIFAAGLSTGLLVFILKIAEVFKALVSPLEGVGDVLDSVATFIDKTTKSVKKVLNGFAKLEKGLARKLNAEAMKSMATAILILVGAIAILTLLDPWKVATSVLAITVLILGLCALMDHLGKIGKDGTVNIVKFMGVLWSLAGVIAIFAIVTALLGNMDQTALDQGYNALLGIGAVIGVLVGILVWISSKGVVITDKAGEVLLQMGITMAIMAVVIKLLGGMDRTALEKGMTAIGGFVVIFALLTLITKLVTPKDISSLGKLLLSMATSMLIMTVVIKLLGTMDEPTLKQGLIVIAILGAVVGGLVAITNLTTAKEISNLGKLLLSMAVSMLIMAIVIKLVGSMDDTTLKQGLIVVAVLGAMVGGLVAITKLATDKQLKGVAATLLAMSVAIAILAAVVMIMGLLSWEHIGRGLAVVGALGVMMAGLIAVTKLANDAKGTIIALAIVIAVMAASLVVLSFIDPERIWPAVGAMGALMAVFAGMLAASKLAKDSMGSIIAMAVVLAVMAVAIGILAQFPSDDLIGSAVALSMLCLAMSVVLVILSKFTNPTKALLGAVSLALVGASLFIFVELLKKMQDVNNAVENAKILITLAAAMSIVVLLLSVAGSLGAGAIIGAVALALVGASLFVFVGVLMAMQGVQNALANAQVLILLAGAMALLLPILAVVGLLGYFGLIGVGLLLLMAVPLIAFVGVLAVMSCVSNALANAQILILLATAMTLLLVPLTIIGLLGVLALAGIACLTSMAIPMLAFIGILAIMNNVQNAMTNANLLIYLMSSITGLLLILAPVAPLALIAAVAVVAMSAAIAAIAGLAIAIGGLMEVFPGLQSFLDTGIPVLEQLAHAIGSMFGNLIAGVVEGLGDSLPKLGLMLSQFMINALPFITLIKMVDASMLEGIAVLAAAVIALTAADLIAGVGSFLSGGSSFATLGTELSQFIINAMPFIMNSKLIDPSIMDGIKTLVEAVLLLTGADILEGLTSWLTGGSSLADFGTELATLGPCLKAYSDAVTGIDNEAIIASSEAAKNLAEMASMLPNSGGLMGAFFGENDMDTFGTQLAAFGTSIKDYCNSVIGIDTSDVEPSVEAAKLVVELAESLPNSGGVLGFFMGENDMGYFGTQLALFGAGLLVYSQKVDGINVEAISASVEAGKELAGLASSLENVGGVVAFFAGDNDLATFGENVSAFGSYLQAYSMKVEGINVEAIGASVTAAEKLSDLQNALDNTGGWISLFEGDNSLATFGNHLVDFGGDLKSYSQQVAAMDVGALDNAVSSINSLTKLVTGMDGVDFGGFNSFMDSLGDLGSGAVENFIAAFSNSYESASTAATNLVTQVIDALKSKNEDVKTAGKTLATNFGDGITKGKNTSVTDAVDSMMTAVVSWVRAKYQKMYNAGSYLVDGFVAGISENDYKAAAQAAAMAEAAEQAAREALDINSPSKVFRKIGTSVPEGFAMGIDKLGYMVKNSTEDMAEGAIQGVSKSISRISDIINSDIDTQPTIRPVLDLSDVQSGASMIDGMFGMNPSMGVYARVGSIGSMMNERQNGDDEVVSAINKLRKDLNNVGNTSYNINGINYTEGDDVAGALQTIVRAAKIERRA